MNRRDFLKAGAALAATAACPPLANSDVLTADKIQSAIAALRSNAAMAINPASYLCYMHPSTKRDLEGMLARDRWNLAYRHYRVLRRQQEDLELGAREIISRYAKPNPMIRRGELGMFEGVRIIPTQHLPVGSIVKVDAAAESFRW